MHLGLLFNVPDRMPWLLPEALWSSFVCTNPLRNIRGRTRARAGGSPPSPLPWRKKERERERDPSEERRVPCIPSVLLGLLTFLTW